MKKPLYQPPSDKVPEIPFTLDAYQKLQEKEDKLSKERKEVMIRLQVAREMGDLSENGAYIYAKFELGSITRQLSQLRHLLKNGKVIQKPTDNSTVGFGCTVTVSIGKKEIDFTLVSMHESNLTERKLSIESPIGSALLGKRMGDVVLVDTPNGKVEYKILKIA